ncbi:transposase [Arthrobacter sp. CG_A4]|nr:transposase [Arthrobacter sp. CG_A4]
MARELRKAGITVLEVNRPNRKNRRQHGKSDPLDAYSAAEAVLAERATAKPKDRDGFVESVRALRVVRSSAMKSRTQTINQITGLLTSAAEEIRSKYRSLHGRKLARALLGSRPGSNLSDPETATRYALRLLGSRYEALTMEILQIDGHLNELLKLHAPDLLGIHGVGTEVAGQLLITAGDNPERIGTEAALAALTGTAPLPASSGKTNRHRLSRSGDRAANSAIHRIVLVRMRHHEATRAYVTKRTEEGLSKREIIRCLKRYVVREIHRTLIRHIPPTPAAIAR